jgi:hypothetical protein
MRKVFWKIVKMGISLAAVLFIYSGALVEAQQQEKTSAQQKSSDKDILYKGAVVGIKELIGELVSLTPRNEPQFIAIAVEKENTDYYFVLAEDVKVVHKKRLSEIAVGDTVKIKYQVIVETTEEGKERRKHVAKVITFVKPHTQPLELKGLRSR